jgi:hypothetical protein
VRSLYVRGMRAIATFLGDYSQLTDRRPRFVPINFHARLKYLELLQQEYLKGLT